MVNTPVLTSATPTDCTGQIPHLLVVDDDTRLRDLIRRFLSQRDWRISTAKNAQDARDILSFFTCDLLIVDIMMPGENGLELTRAIAGKTPILLLSAMGESTDRIAGLESGADDYLPKPFEPRELALRCQAILKRTQTPQVHNQNWLSFGPFRFDLQRGQLWKVEGGDHFIHLTESETALLSTLAHHPDHPVSREDLARATGADSTSRTVDVQMTRLRRKIEPDPRRPRYLHTLRGRGYCLACASSSQTPLSPESGI